MLGKVLDNIILLRNENVLFTSDLQFGFKRKHSTTQCSYVIDEVVNYYNTGGSDVYTMFLDATKAFGRVNYIKLFRIHIDLSKRSYCLFLVRADKC